jgi:hypothetical protein
MLHHLSQHVVEPMSDDVPGCQPNAIPPLLTCDPINGRNRKEEAKVTCGCPSATTPSLLEGGVAPLSACHPNLLHPLVVRELIDGYNGETPWLK